MWDQIQNVMDIFAKGKGVVSVLLSNLEANKEKLNTKMDEMKKVMVHSLCFYIRFYTLNMAKNREHT